MKKRFWSILCMITVAFVIVLNLSGCTSGNKEELLSEELPEVQQDASIPIDDEYTAEGGKDATVVVPDDSDTDGMIAVNVENIGRSNPFMPPREWSQISAVPSDGLKYELLPPLETPSVDSSAKTVVTTKVSGIMYDKNSPSAIINIDGSDYLVRAGDVLNGYKVLSIGRSVVTVQLGANVYKAGVGELLADGKSGITYNQVANLSSKFGGQKK